MSKFSTIIIGCVLQMVFCVSLVCGQVSQLYPPEIRAYIEGQEAEQVKIEKMMIKFHETQSKDVLKTDGPPKIQEAKYLYLVMLKNTLTILSEDPQKYILEERENTLAKLRQIRQRFLYLGNCQLEISAIDKQIEILNLYPEMEEKYNNLEASVKKQIEDGNFERGFNSGFAGAQAGALASDMGFEAGPSILIGLGVTALNIWASSEQVNNKANEYLKEQANILVKEYLAKAENIRDELLAIIARLKDKYSYVLYTDEEKKDTSTMLLATYKRGDILELASTVEPMIYDLKVQKIQNRFGGQIPENGFSPLDNVKRMIGYAASLPDVPLYDEDRKIILKSALDLIYKARQYGKLDNIMFYQYCWELYLIYDDDLDGSEKQRFLELLHGQGKYTKAYKVAKRISSVRENDFSFCTRMVSLATQNKDYENAFRWLEKMMQLSAGQRSVYCLRTGQPFKDENIPFIPENIFNTLKQYNPDRFTRIVNLNY